MATLYRCTALRGRVLSAHRGQALSVHRGQVLPAQRRLYCARFQPPSRSILSQRIEAAAREGDVDKVRAILKEHDAHSTFQGSTSSASARPRLLPWVLAYFGWNAVASAYDYRLLGTEAAACLGETNGLGTVQSSMHLRSFSFSAEMSSRHGPLLYNEEGSEDANDGENVGENDGGNDRENRGYSSLEKPARKRVRTIPHIYLTDLVWGRSEWTLNCRKGGGQTAWFTGSGDGSTKPPKGGGGSSFEWSSSSSSSWRS